MRLKTGRPTHLDVPHAAEEPDLHLAILSQKLQVIDLCIRSTLISSNDGDDDSNHLEKMIGRNHLDETISSPREEEEVSFLDCEVTDDEEQDGQGEDMIQDMNESSAEAGIDLKSSEVVATTSVVTTNKADSNEKEESTLDFMTSNNTANNDMTSNNVIEGGHGADVVSAEIEPKDDEEEEEEEEGYASCDDFTMVVPRLQPLAPVTSDSDLLVQHMLAQIKPGDEALLKVCVSLPFCNC
jgi:hypothetical protein